MTIEVAPSSAYVERAADRLGVRLRQRERGKPFHFFCSGGSTPRPIYSALVQAIDDWEGVHFWLGDERYVPWDHPDSNFRMLKETLLNPAGIAPSYAHPWPILASPELSAQTYDREFHKVFVDEKQSLDLQLLGMGTDGHTASLFPGSPALLEQEKLCVANLVDAQEKNRLTLTFHALAQSLHVVFLVRGSDKAIVLKEVLQEKKHPAAQVQGRESTTFFLDEDAAKLL